MGARRVSEREGESPEGQKTKEERKEKMIKKTKKGDATMGHDSAQSPDPNRPSDSFRQRWLTF